MKSLAELRAIRESMQQPSNRLNQETTARIMVGMGTCGIAAGARTVLLAVMDELATRNLQHVAVAQTGCMGMCEKEPLVEIDVDGQKTTYAYINADKVRRLVLEHIVNGSPITEWAVTK
ncbi:MAG: (2Fe-2S) ferredoxin domain-containing protein [Bacillota bacterium]|nr:(2Fe-2S) ferredoxin domain-containing protein [Bacillota bacterium]